ncbi:MAG: hypothetical protein QNL00_07380 [Saprospiraceae bacterium]
MINRIQLPTLAIQLNVILPSSTKKSKRVMANAQISKIAESSLGIDLWFIAIGFR